MKVRWFIGLFYLINNLIPRIPLCVTATHQSVLDLLTDVLEEFFVKIAERVKIAQDDESEGKLCGFPVIKVNTFKCSLKLLCFRM